jgi:predicted RNase H-like nuclease (RuvC/YqgF family)
MALKYIVATLTDVEETLRSHYEPRDGRFVIKLEGFDFATAEENARKLAEFRDNNRALNATKAELEAKLKALEGIDPAEVTALKAKVTELEGKLKGSKGADDVQKLLEAAVAPLKKQLDDLGTERNATAQKLADKELESALQTAGIKAGVDEKALPDYIRRGKEIFSMVDGKMAAKKGDTPLFSKDRPAEPLSMDEWAKALPAEAPHLFKTSGGGGATPGPGGPGNGAVRTIPAGARITAQDMDDIAKGVAVRGEAVA